MRERSARRSTAGRPRSFASLGLAACLLASGCSGATEHAPYAESLASGGASGALLVESGSAGARCVPIEQHAPVRQRPVDVIFVVDNSASMSDEIAAVQARINDDFAAIIGASGLDYRVILISRYGALGTPVGESQNPICIGAPLGGSDCSDAARAPLRNSERFFHYSADIESHDAWCALLGGFASPDEYGDDSRPGWISAAPDGYSRYLRPEAFKTFVVISDDDVDCEIGGMHFRDAGSIGGGERAAAAFDQALLALSPEQFGSAQHRNYVWHSIAGFAASRALAPGAPIQSARCEDGAEGPGTGYQALSQLTAGVRYSSCANENFDAVFTAIAAGVVSENVDVSFDCEAPSVVR